MRSMLIIGITLLFLISSISSQIWEYNPISIQKHEESRESTNNIIHWTNDFIGIVTNTYCYGQGGTVYTANRGYADGIGNYYISGFIVSWNQTLIIYPGVTVHFEGYYANQFVVYGQIQAIGTEAEPIVFTTNSSEPSGMDWNGIHINTPVTFRYCRFEYSAGIICDEITIQHCDFFSDGGISARIEDENIDTSKNTLIEISNCTFSNGTSSVNIEAGNANTITLVIG
jgi:hypothetical protein